MTATKTGPDAFRLNLQNRGELRMLLRLAECTPARVRETGEVVTDAWLILFAALARRCERFRALAVAAASLDMLPSHVVESLRRENLEV